ncbi:hypothetical protein SS1G_03435 [Sclerotinia sclerotiorum 1980 UF-70]|uniref:Major facilitator superfamily (MFS) profile domain-containing protein n=1 Tax=Sclerotinia sclerotiorum (strain ATCC 18683 / 1980 / Ss-1) TaxID=665079 RepID=A7EDP5_SCLS1|nr:hypothetical protein SS1G_03435 [Sclerotinia sclerotiorum 1980 UF-70]EDO00961.1 hypothetical protein SS1G_03435 [Sclerotinia sclerotiorum 1980 UF-70]
MPSLLEDSPGGEMSEWPATETLELARADQEAQAFESSYLTGWRFYGTIVGLVLANGRRAQTSTQLIILRAFQGIGGAGMYNMAMVILAEAVPPSEFPKYVSLVAAITAIAFAVGPLIGGALTSHATWRWVFWIKVSFLTGAPFTCATIQIPQRYQTVNGLSPYDAGVRLLAFIVMAPVGAVIGAGLADKFKIKPTYALIGGAVFQLIGAICFVTMPYSSDIKSSQYGFQVIFGIGSGMSNAIATTSVPFIVQRKDIPAALGANTQFRYLGGAIGLGLITSVFNSNLRPRLATILDPEQLYAILQSAEIIKTLSEEQKGLVLEAFAHGFTLQWKVILALISAQVPAAIMMCILECDIL